MDDKELNSDEIRRFIEQLLLHKEHIIELNDLYFNGGKQLYFTQKFYEQSFKIYFLKPIILYCVELFRVIAPNLSLSIHLQALVLEIEQDYFTVHHNERWLNAPFRMYSLYTHFAILISYLAHFVSKSEITEGQQSNIYWRLRFTLYSGVKECTDSGLIDGIEHMPLGSPPSILTIEDGQGSIIGQWI